MSDSRIEALLEALLNGTDPPGEPQSRVEAYLYALCERGLGSGDGIGIKSIEQTTTSIVDGGTNIITITLTNDDIYTFEVKNGSKGSKGDVGSDYIFSEEDKAELVTDVLNALPTWNGGAY